MEGVKATWFSGTEDELVRELLDDESPLLFLQEDPEQGSTDEPAMNQLISTYYSGPTIQDIENAGSTTSQKVQSPQRAVSQARIAILERNLSKMENNKYTLKLKSCGDGMADDGYKWRKYGQKSIKNSPYPRSYYRCVNRRCSAKKHVERSTEDKDTLVITYDGLHLHFAHPHFLVDQPHSMYSSFKKPKRAISGSESKNPEAQQSAKEARESIALSSPVPSLGTLEDPTQELGSETLRGPQGLLEDVVPFMIRNPSANIASSNSSSCSSYRSPPPSPSSLSWSPVYPYSCFDIGINH